MFNKVASNSNKTVAMVKSAFFKAVSFNGGKGKEGNSSASLVFKKANCFLCCVFVGNNNVLKSGANCGFNRKGIFCIYGKNFGNGIKNSAKCAGGTFIKNKFYRSKRLISLFIL